MEYLYWKEELDLTNEKEDNKIRVIMFQNYLKEKNLNIFHCLKDNEETIFRAIFDIGSDLEFDVIFNNDSDLIEFRCIVNILKRRSREYEALILINDLNKKRGMGKYILNKRGNIIFKCFILGKPEIFDPGEVLKIVLNGREILEEDYYDINEVCGPIFLAIDHLKRHCVLETILIDTEYHIEFISSSLCTSGEYNVLKANIEDNRLKVYRPIDDSDSYNMFDFGEVEYSCNDTNDENY